MKLPLVAGLLVLPLLALKAAPVVVDDHQDDPAPNPIFGPLYPDAATDTMRHFDAGVNDVLYGADGVLGAKNARLMAVAASAAIKCEYCVMAQKELARAAGATEEERRVGECCADAGCGCAHAINGVGQGCQWVGGVTVGSDGDEHHVGLECSRDGNEILDCLQ